MSMLTQPGRFLARPQEWTLGETKSGLPQFVCRYRIAAYQGEGGQWVDCSSHALEISGYQVLFKRDGSPNHTQLNSLSESLGWDGASLASLAQGDWSQVRVQITVEEETYNGASRLKVTWVNPESWEGPGLKKLDPQGMQQLSLKWDAKLRASRGGVGPMAAPRAPSAVVPKAQVQKPMASKAPLHKQSRSPDLMETTEADDPSGPDTRWMPW